MRRCTSVYESITNPNPNPKPQVEIEEDPPLLMDGEFKDDGDAYDEDSSQHASPEPPQDATADCAPSAVSPRLRSDVTISDKLSTLHIQS